VASERFDFTSQNKFSLARLFFCIISYCVQYVWFLAELRSVNMPLCNLKSEELGCWPFFPTHTNTTYSCVQGKLAGTMLFTPVFSVSVIMTNIEKSYLIWACHRTEKRWEDIYLIRCFDVKYRRLLLRVVLYFDEPVGRVKIQTMSGNIRQYFTPKHLTRDLLSNLTFFNLFSNLKENHKCKRMSARTVVVLRAFCTITITVG